MSTDARVPLAPRVERGFLRRRADQTVVLLMISPGGLPGAAPLSEAVLQGVVVFSLPVYEVGKSVLTGSAPCALLVVAAVVFTKLQVPTLQKIVDHDQERIVASRSTTAELPAARTPAAPLADPKLSYVDGMIPLQTRRGSP